MSYVKLVGTKNRHTGWTAEYVLETDDDGNVTKSVKAGIPSDVSASNQKKLEDQFGAVFESSSKEEAEKASEQFVQVPGADVAPTPAFGDVDQANQK